MPLAAQAHTCALHTRSVCRTLASSSHSPSHMCTSPSVIVPPHSSTQTCVSHALTCCVSLIHPPPAHMPPCRAHTPIPVAHDPSLAHLSHTTHAPMSRTPAPRHIPCLAHSLHFTHPVYLAQPLPITHIPHMLHTHSPSHMPPVLTHSPHITLTCTLMSHTHTHTPRAHSSTCLTHTAPSYATPQPYTLTPVPCAPCLAPPFARTRCHMHVHSPRTLTSHTHTCTLTPFHFMLCTLTVSHIHHTLIVTHGCTLAPPQQQSSGCGSNQWGWAEELGALG